MKFARVNGVVLHYEAKGRDNLPALVFANSLGTDFRIWDDVVERLEGRFRFIRYDKRGHGLSETTPPPYSMETHVRDLAALLDHLGVAQAAVVGLSIGGMIVQGLAALRPDLVAALVLSNTAPQIGTEELWNARIETATTRGIAPMAVAVLERWFTPAYRSPDNPDFAGYRAMLTRSDPQGYAGACAALRDADLTESTRALKIPVLCLVGDQDGSTPPALVKSMADIIPGARFEIVKDCGHLPCVEQPERTAALIGDFLDAINYTGARAPERQPRQGGIR